MLDRLNIKPMPSFLLLGELFQFFFFPESERIELPRVYRSFIELLYLLIVEYSVLILYPRIQHIGVCETLPEELFTQFPDLSPVLVITPYFIPSFKTT